MDFKKKSYLRFIIFIIFSFSGLYPAMALEKAKYDVIEKEGSFEIRKYHDHIIAETCVNNDFEDAGSIGFRRLFNYIDGNNTTGDSIVMTAPVSQQKKSEKISMTAPVTMHNQSGTYCITFFIPSRYTMETMPKPLDERITIKKENGKTMAAYEYSGGWGKKRYEKMKKKLVAIIEKRNLKTAGEPVFARYNSPFMPWLFRRNELLIEIVYD